MKIRVNLNKLLDSRFRFYLNNEYRYYLFFKLKKRYKDWRIVAKNLNINARDLFAKRRGYNLLNNKKAIKFLSPQDLINIKRELKISFKEIEKEIEIIKNGNSGLSNKVTLPMIVDLNKEPISSIKRALAEYILTKEIKIRIEKPNGIIIKNKIPVIRMMLTKKEVEPIRLTGHRPNLVENEKEYELSYTSPKTKGRIIKIIPKTIIFNETFAKEFGKWIGDRCGGDRSVKVGNKNSTFIKEFKSFLEKELKQRNCKTILEHNKNFNPSKNLVKRCNEVKIRKLDTNYTFRTGLSHRILRKKCFDVFERNIFYILFKSKKSIRHAFFAGLIEAEGSVSLRPKEIVISTGSRISESTTNERVINLLKKAILYRHLLQLDKINPIISRKVSSTKKPTLKYDIKIVHSNKTAKEMLPILKRTIIPFINHEDKVKKLKKMEILIAKN